MKWIREHFIVAWVIASILYAFIIHCLFSMHAPNDWLVAKWTAGEILTYASTVSLGLLALWQNKKFKDENDIAQARLERLTEQANELSTVSAIIEIENERLERLKEALDAFSTSCDCQTIAKTYAENSTNSFTIAISMVSLEEKIDDSFFKAFRELRLDISVKQDDNVPVKKTAVAYYLYAKEIVKKLKESPATDIDKELEVLASIRNEFLSAREKYIGEQEKKLNQVAYGNMGLAEIKKLYKRED